MQRIAIVGNAGGGKSTLARRLSTALGLPLYEVDGLQWRPGWTPAPADEIASAHARWLAQPAWIIDGWGGWPAMRARFERADTVVLVDFPLAVHYAWALKRQALAALGRSPHWPPPGCRALPITGRLLRLMWRIHVHMRPQLLALVEAQRDDRRVVHLRSPGALERFAGSVEAAQIAAGTGP